MRTATIHTDYRTIQAMLRALDLLVITHPEDKDAAAVRNMIIEVGAVMEIQAIADLLLEEQSTENHGCEHCESKDECHPPKEQIN